MLNWFRHIITMLLLLIAIQAVGQLEVVDNVCVNANRKYRIDGEKNSTYEWKLYDNLSGATVTLTNPAGTPFAETTPEKYGSEVEILWNKPGEFRLAAIQYSAFGCDTLQQGIIKVFDHPVVTPGVPALVCAGQSIPITGTTALNYSIVRWETSGDGTFDDASTLTPTYTPGPNDLAAGVATLTIHAEGLGDPTSCTEAVESLTITISNMQLAATATDAKCYGSADGTAKAELTGAYGTTTFAWTGSNGFTGNQAEVTGLLAGTYSVTATDQNGCTASGSVTVNEPLQLVATASATPAGCFGSSDGTAIVSASGGTGSYTYQWNDAANQTTSKATGLLSGIYTVTVTDANGCTASASVAVGEPLLLVATATSTSVSCYGGNNGSATVLISGGTASYTYSWNDAAAQKSKTAVGLVSGTFVVTITDANGCTTSASVTVDQPALLTAIIDGTDAKCFGGTDGSATVKVIGGTASFTFLWNDPLAQTTATATGLKTGNYQVKVTDANGCTTSASITISQPSLLVASVSGTPAKCYNGSDGTATVNVSGGTATYTYLWSDPLAQTGATAVGLMAGTYTVTVTDQNLCQVTASATISQPTPILITETHIDSKCSGSKPGSIDISVSGGTPGYTYAWVGTNGFTSITEDISGLAGTQSYTVTVTDANGCTASSNIYIDEEKNLIISETHQNLKCNNDASGSIDIKVVGGKKDFVYTWYDLKDLGTVIATTEDIAGVQAGTYRITVVDANACSDTKEITLTQPEKLVATASGTNVKCSAGKDGLATVSVSGGTASYTYSWNDPANQTSATATGLGVGTYTVTVTDVNACTTSASVTLTEPAQLVASVSDSAVKCFGGNDGTASVSVSGGLAPYTYLWNDPAAQTTSAASNLAAGTYRVDAKDSNGCSISATTTIAQPLAPLAVAVSTTDVKCNGGNNGTASSTVSGGTSPYSYLWNDAAAQTTPVAAGLKAGTYILTITDANGCTGSATVIINEPNLLAATVTGTDVKCFGGTDGTATVSPAGGLLPYNYLWNDGAAQTTAKAIGLTSGTYQVKVTDANGCVASATYTVNQPSAPLAISISGTDAKCFGANSGQATASVSGGTTPYTYLWNDASSQTTATAVGLGAGTFSVTVSDANGCTVSSSVVIGQPTQLVASVSGVNLKCFGATDGSTTVSVSGGTGSYTYLWDDPAKQTTATASGLGAGVYGVIATDANGCTVTASITLTEPAASVTAAVSGINVKCFGGKDGSATVVSSGGTATYTYLWDDPLSQKTATASNLAAGDYRVVVTDANGCTTSAAITITEPALLTATASGTDVKCFGGNDGTATVLASGGTGSCTYLWSDPAAQKTATASGLKIGNYQVVVTDANGCTASATVSINEPSQLTVTASKTDVKCFGGNDGSATVLASGGTATYTYLWNDSMVQTTATAVNLRAGIYLIQVTDANGCSVTSSVTINEPAAAVTALIAGTDVKCWGSNDGQATVSASGGTGSYTYLWSDPTKQTTATATGLTAGTYQVVVTDANGCSASASVTINEPPQLTASVSGTNVKCFGGKDGSATVVASGGTATYTYLWDDPLAQKIATASGLAAGNYRVVVTDANGCTTSAAITITEPALLTASALATDVKCFGGNDGTATVLASGGAVTYTYLWDDPAKQTAAIATALSKGTYHVVVTDANGCTASASVTIKEPSQLTASATGTDVKCFGGNDGSATVSASGGTGSYTYQWNDPAAQTTATVTGLRAGTYQVTVADANACTVSATITIKEPSNALAATITSTDVKCNGGADGSATVSVSGGTPNYTYLWNDVLAQTTSTATNLKAGAYQVMVTDLNGCSTSASVTINEPPLLTVSASGTNVKCFGGNDGEATASVSGGTPNYSYIWNDLAGQTSAKATGLKAGTYQVKVTDANGCVATTTITITEPLLLAASASGTNIKCFGGNDGTATVLVSGGTASYTYSWNDPALQTGQTATGLRAGSYQVTVTDANGCKATDSVILTEPAMALAATTTTTNVKCFGGNDGSATVSVTGGTAAYTYLWNDAAAQTTAIATGLKAGTYQVLITDANGCTLSASVTINEPPAGLQATATESPVKCFGGSDGNATVSVTGGTPAYTYLWDDAAAQIAATAVGLVAGTYHVLVTDTNACTSSATVVVTQPAAPLALNISANSVKCFGGSDGSATAIVSGGTAAYTYLWDDSAHQTTATANNLKAGSYIVIVTDANGCTISSSVTISEPPALLANVSGTNVKCYGGIDGSATVTVSGGTPNYNYLWNDPVHQTTQTASNLSAGAYQVTVTDANGCIATGNITITQPAVPLAAVVSATPVKCFGGNDGSVSVIVSGGTAAYTYLWNDAAAHTTSSVSGLTAGIYKVVVTDANGCTVSASVTVTEPPADLAVTATGVDVKCYGGNDGKANAAVTGGTPVYTYKWSDASSQTTATATGLVAGNYKVVVTDANGCNTSATVTIKQPLSIPTSTSSVTVCQNLLPFSWNGNSYPAGGTYSVTLTTKLGCDSIAVLKLQIEIPKVPTFTPIATLCKGSAAPALPNASTNGYTGTWLPAVISTAVVGTTTYTFTPDAGQCATTANLAVTVIEPVVPVFAAIGPLCLNSTAPPLLPVSINSIPGTWSPAVISTSAVGITNYIFTPAAGQCATTATLSIEVSAPQAFAGLPETICPGNPYTLATATAQNYSSLLWSKSGDGTFDNPTILHPVYTPGQNDIATGIVTLTLTAQGVGTAPGCVPAVSSVTLNIIQLDADVKYSDVTCYEANDGQIIITSPGTGNYEYQVDGFGWQTKTQYKNLSPGIYKVDIRETSIPSCVRTLATITIVQPEPLSATVETQDATCLGNDGIISIPSQDGGSGSYEYSLNDGPWTSTGYFAGLVPGSYHLDMRDLNVPTCAKDLGKWTIGMPVPVTAKVDKVDVSCASGNDGKIVISDAKNGSGTYEFNIGGDWSTQFTFENLTAGTYNVQMRDYNAKECVQPLGTITVGEPAPLQAIISHTNITCNGRKDGTISVQSPTGGSGTYEYTIDGTSWVSTTNFSNLGPGTYYILMRDKAATKCVVSFLPVDVLEPLPLAATVTKSDITCFGAHDGKVVVSNPQNGTLPYQYQVNGTGWQTASQFNGLGTNTYTVEISDANGCKETLGAVFIVEPKPLTASVDHTDETCIGNDGTISISNPQNSASGLYEFTIDGGTTWTSTTIFTDLAANSYVVKIRDANLATCEQPLGTIKIVAPIPLAAIGTSSDVTCYGANDGIIHVKNPSGGSGLYEYSVDGATWTSSTTIVNLSPNNYTLIMRDLKAQTCSITVGTYTIIQPEQLAATASPTDVTCYGGTDGMISFSGAKGGSGSYEYSVDGKNWFANKIQNLKADFYNVQMRDANVHTCIVLLGSVQVKEPEKITADVKSTPVTCFGANDGTITINNTQNGKPPYQYSLNGVAPWQSSNVFTGVKAGTYDLIVVSDANSCVSTLAVVTIIEPEKLEAKYTSTNETLPGANDGVITIIGQKGGSGVFEYSKDGTTWQASDTFTGLTPATYTIVMRDANSITCTFPISITISPAGTLSAEYTINPVTCYGGLDGSITFKNPRGAAHYQFSIDNGNSWGATDQFAFGGLAAQSYTLVVRDADNIANKASLATKDIAQPDQLQAVVTVTPESFPGAKDGGITFSSVQGGSGIYDYSIDGANWTSSGQFTGLSSGNYTAWLRDHNAQICQVPYVRTIQPAGELVADVTPVNVLCNGQNTGSILITNASGAAVIEYGIDSGSGFIWNKTGVFNGLVAGSYKVTIRDANKTANTVSLGTIKITEPTKLQAIFSNYTAPLCTGTFGSFSISASGGTPPYKGTGDFILPTGVSKNYVVSDKNGCTAQQYVSMPDPPKIVATGIPNPPKCFGDMGSITISATGGTGALKGVGTFPVQAGKAYSFKVTDANGCSSNIISGIMPPEEMLAVTITPLSSMCAGGSIDLLVSATGGTPVYSGTGTVTVTLGSVNTYTYTVTDSGGCTASKSITIKTENPPAVPVISVVTQPICSTPFGTIRVESPLGANYEYSIDGGTYTKTALFGGLAPESTHTIKVKDITTGCENISAAITIGAMPESLGAPALTVTQPGCIVPTGAIEVADPASGTGFEYKLDSGVYTSTAYYGNLAQGSTHSVTVRNIATGCFSAAAAAVIGTTPVNPAKPLLALTATPTCSNPDGNVSVVSPVNSGSKVYSYSIDGVKFQASPVFVDLTGTTTYTVVVRDDVSGCTSSPTAIYVPAVPPPPVILVSGVNPKCYGDTYTITVSVPPVVSAGKTYSFTGTYTFYYDGGQFDNVKISGGIATITGTLTASKDFKNINFSANGCTSTGTNTSISIVSPAAIDLRIVQVTEQAVKGTQQGSIDIDAKGGTGLLSYKWSNGATTQDLNPIKYGTYSVVVTDTRNCTATLSVKVPLNNPPVARPDEFITSCSSVSGNLLADNGSGKDYDPDPAEQNDFITFNTVLVTSPTHAASFKVDASGNFEYTAKPNFSGDDIFVYEIYDKLKQTATATVTIHVVSDFDGDGIPDLVDPDADGDGILNVDEVLPGQDWKTADFDGDGHPNWLDIDSDNDGIVDNIEAQPTAGYIPPSGKDVNHNGIDDAYDPLEGGVKLVPVNTDANLYMPDNQPDFLDADSDNDQVPDYIEGHDYDADGKVDPGHSITGKDSDGDGLDDAWDTIVNGCNNLNATGSNAFIQDFDGDGIRDWRDDNDDDDEYPTRLEDLNGDGDYSNDVTGHVGHPEYLWYGRDCSLFIPDAFSPNDDNIHDYFQIYCIEQYPNAKMYIFDQQGNKLFEKDHYGNVDFWGSHEQAWWDGTTTNRIAAVNGRKVVPGTYYYVLKLGNGETKKSFVFVSY